MTKNEHLIPAMVIDIGNAIANNFIQSHVRENYLQRLEATVEYCQSIITKSKITPVKRGK